MKRDRDAAVNCNLMDNLVVFEATTLLEIIGREREIFGIKILLASYFT